MPLNLGDEASLDSLRNTAISLQSEGLQIVSPSWSANHVFPYFGAVSDGIFYIDGFADASGTASPLTYTKMFGGNATKTGHGNLDAHWASISHQGDGEAGLFIGDVTAPTGSPGGNMWGGHFQLNAQVAANMNGLRLDFNPTVPQGAKAALGLVVTNQVDANSLTNAIRTAGHWSSHIICYSDAAQTTSIFRVDQSGNVTAVGDVLATRNLLVGSAPDAQGAIGTIPIRNAAGGPGGTPVGGGILFVAAGALKWIGSSGTTTTLAPA